MKKYFRGLLVLTILLIPGLRLTALNVEDTPEPPPAIREKLVLSFTGDMMAHVINYKMPDYSLIYRDIEKILMSDSLTFSNVEFPVNPKLPQASYPVFNIHPEYVEAAVNAGVDVLSIANNHTADQGTKGLIATVEAMQQLCTKVNKQQDRDVRFSGAKVNPDTDFSPITIYKNGWKIGYLAVSQFSNVTPRPGHMMMIDFNNSKRSDEFIRWLEPQIGNYDLFILSYHGGIEYQPKPLKRKTEFFHKLIASGVNIIWGHHPHIVQPVEVVTIGGKEGVIMNSLGNFISGQGRIIDPDLPEEEWSYTGDSAILQVELSSREGNTIIDNVTAIPTANIFTTNREVVIAPLEDLTHQPVPEPWMNFFLERFILMHDYFNRNIQYSVLP
ncbi:MAG: CapA family protein [Spirochaetales bacterium]|nr:CapA family protein [Spirochaetales bacterium]